MSTNPHFPPSGSPPVASTPFDPNAPAVGAPTTGTRARAESSEISTGFRFPQSLLRSQILREMIFLFRKAPQPEPWTDEDYVRYAENTFWA